ncbi:MAG: DUF1588 domain-containing protein [Planctomycetaceae bacterium]|nr:DUF1588 domain-containing protein [Planctomycetaceae bacterium]
MRSLVVCLCVLILQLIGSFALADEVTALLHRYCADCHNQETKEGGLSIQSLKEFKDAKPQVWSSIREQLQLRQMPPKESPQPTIEERQRVVTSIAASLRTGGQYVNNKLDWPNYGNYVPHAALFTGQPHPAPATGVRIWRQRPAAYAVRNGGGIQAFSMVPGQQIADYSALYTVDESAAEIVLRNAQQVVEVWSPVELHDSKLRPLPGKQPATWFLPILNPEREPTPEQFAQSVNWAFNWAITRSATAEELTRIRQLYDQVNASHGRLQAGRSAVTVPLLMPEAIYRLELGAGPLDEHGRRRLTKHEILGALHQTLFDSHPPQAIYDARVKVELATREEVAALVDKLLSTTRPNARLLNFFDEYFDYRKATAVFKEPPADVDFNASNLVRDTQRLIETIVADDREVLRRLLTTTETYISDDSDLPRGQRIYNLPDDFKWQAGLIALSAEERAGILTQPSWLIAHSGNFDNDPVRRGKWILEHLLGGTVPDLPISVCAVVPPDEAKTLRERFEVIRKDAYCWKCHQQMNPLGMSFEAFDHFGRYRLKEQNRPVDVSGAVVDIGDQTVDGPVAHPVELIQRLANSKRVQEVFVRYAFRYFLGRNETVRDAKTLQEANRAYETSGGSMKALVISLLSSDSFLYRTVDL